ncbi:MAG TPA: M56 family metallopeptidase, partial [Nannocystaceae bacterium]|nr:M56 family metallopeptidase [Nannocystaceae bacterium]
MTEWIVAMNLWCAALVVIAVALDVLLARRVRPAWRVALYATVALRLALPIDWHGPLAGTLAKPQPSRTTLVAADAPQLIGATHVVEPQVSPLSNEAVMSIAAPSWHAADLVAPLWIAVSGVLLAVYVLRRRALAVRLRSCTPARARVATLARGVTVLEHDALGPLTFGIVHARIVLPRALVGELSDDELAHVLAHERAHVLRRDGALVAALALVCIAAWPVLPVWLAAARVRRLIELAADDRALAGAGAAERISFGHTLLRLAGTRAGTGALALGGYRDLRGRIRALRRRGRMPAAIELGTIATAIALPLACTGEPESAPRCAALKDEAIAAHDRVEQGERERAPEALAAYDAFAQSCHEHPDHAELLYYRAELRWSVAHALAQSGSDSRAAY